MRVAVTFAFGQGVAERVGMAEALAFDDFDLVREDRRRGKLSNA